MCEKALILMQREEVGLPKTTFKPASIFSRKDIGPPLVLSSEVTQNRGERVKQTTGDSSPEGKFPKPLQHPPNLHLNPASDQFIFGNCFLHSYHQKTTNQKTNQLGKLANLRALKLMWDSPTSPQASGSRDDPGVRPCWLCLWLIWVLT